MTLSLPLDHEAIKTYLPHRYPFLLVDRVTDLVAGESAQGYKNVSGNEEVFNGHFPGQAIFPGVMICEALAQLSAILGFATSGNRPADGYLYLFAGLDNVKFKRQVVPGDRLELHSKLVSERRGIFRFECRAEVDGQLAATADIVCAERKQSS
ncbi:3-hydroxyacyl-[acyl-carrier-protein] dehydratase FabZ [Saccharospirillum sp. MSK14-1]|uniref:3-hydroxyacyl-ACP dehydratase FabZ n=1 Tax=Saccharospirillum sp. MSK14-1 TaxID=1897632 RepID=UPI000D3A9AEF|nr:3-hydroxyacyl-ACP dehydratase FabZ [Saccharospirillum sp. MSK14-1]PTY37176.1 3-hydroxyacyl-[acyl-carrier-protein] dehydratase FabZ [Saccharospirillum sp. MSK14-1]